MPTIFYMNTTNMSDTRGESTVAGIQSGGDTLASQNVVYGGLSGNALNSSSVGNCLIGYGVGTGLTSGTFNAVLGHSNLSQLTTGSYNLALGLSAGFNYISSESSNICISNAGVVAENNTIRIGTEGNGNGQQNMCFIAGIANQTVTGSAVFVDTGTGQLALTASAERFKENINDMGQKSEMIMQLRPVTFNLKADADKVEQYGLIAEEVLEVMPELVGFNSKGETQTVHYHMLPALLLNEVQKLRKELNELKGAQKC